MKSSHCWWIITILVLAFGLRLISLNQSLWLDEAIEWWAVKSFDLKQLLTGYMIGDFNPPGHHLLMWVWVRMFGDSEISLRFPSVLFGVGTVWFVYKISELIFQNSDLGGKKENSSLIASLFVAVNGLMIYYSQEARMYAMAAFFVTGAIYWHIKGKRLGNLGYFGYFVFMGLALYSHYLTWIMVPLMAIWGIKYLLPLVLTIPWWPILTKQLQAGLSAAGNSVWADISQTSFLNVALVAVKFVTGRIPFPKLMTYQAILVLAIILFWLMVYLGAKSFWKKSGNIAGGKVIIYWAIVPVVAVILVGIFVPVFTYFRLLFVLPAVLILAAAGSNRRWFMNEILMIFMMLTGFLYLAGENFHRENWREAVAELHRQDSAPVMLIHPAVKPPFDYYDRGNSSVITKRSDLESSRSDINKISIVWYIPYAQPIFDKDDSTRKYLADMGYVRNYEKHFQGVTLEKWELGNNPITQ